MNARVIRARIRDPVVIRLVVTLVSVRQVMTETSVKEVRHDGVTVTSHQTNPLLYNKCPN